MSGTSMDGIDAALIETDGRGLVRPVAFRGEPWSDRARSMLREAVDLALRFESPRPNAEIHAVEEMVTRSHVMAVRKLLVDARVSPADIAVVGFHGQTIAHRPDRGWTWQIGDGAAMAAALGVPVVNDFRSADVGAGGQGAPLLPVYHRALVAEEPKPVAILNLGGVGNLTFIGEGDELIAFDTGPANALVDDWMLAETGKRFDEGGEFAATGRVDEAVLTAMLNHPYFDQAPPKSLDRADFTMDAARGLSAEDGAVTLTAFTAITVSYGLRLCPAPPKRLIVAGGGRHNATLMAMLAEACGIKPEPIEVLGWDGDAIEAQGFAYMAVRSLEGMPISFPGTTGVGKPLTGGVLNLAPS
jgi:anhydro-N-acetylmuramic acid kinase